MIKVFCNECEKEIPAMNQVVRFTGEVRVETVTSRGETDAPGSFIFMNDVHFCSHKCASQFILDSPNKGLYRKES